MLLTRHELEFEGVCPVDGSADKYALTVESATVVPVEAILAVLRSINLRQYQEDITRDIFQTLPHPMVRVITVGHHSGVKTTCEVS